jgi:hypothetical protein
MASHQGDAAIAAGAVLSPPFQGLPASALPADLNSVRLAISAALRLTILRVLLCSVATSPLPLVYPLRELPMQPAASRASIGFIGLFPVPMPPDSQ